MILYKHIKNVKTENEAKLLLADIQVRRDAGIFNWFTNISKNIWKLFTSINSSDLFNSNLVFINIILKYHHLYHNFKDIFTNPAYFNKNEQYLIIEQYGQQICVNEK
ncbi:unnamed protein product [Rotaria sp. Silwood1]|nr:unnamed protein product [Rotaria sp. Silwood1]